MTVEAYSNYIPVHNDATFLQVAPFGRAGPCKSEVCAVHHDLQNISLQKWHSIMHIINTR